MRKIIVAAALCLLAWPAGAQDLRGQWDAIAPSLPAYAGIYLIDAERRVTYDSPHDGRGPAKALGYIAQANNMSLQIKLTNGTIVVRIDCSILSSDFLNCQATIPDGGKGAAFMLKRVGPGPQKLTRSSAN